MSLSLTPDSTNFKLKDYQMSQITTQTLCLMYDFFYNSHYSYKTSEKLFNQEKEDEKIQKLFEKISDTQSTIKDVSESLSMLSKVKDNESLTNLVQKEPGIVFTRELIESIIDIVMCTYIPKENIKFKIGSVRDFIFLYNHWEHPTEEEMKTQEGKKQEKDLQNGLKDLSDKLMKIKNYKDFKFYYNLFKPLFFESVIKELELNDHILPLGKVDYIDESIDSKKHIVKQLYALNVMSNPTMSLSGFSKEFTYSSVPYIIWGYMVKEGNGVKIKPKLNYGETSLIVIQTRLVEVSVLRNLASFEVSFIISNSQNKDGTPVVNYFNFELDLESYLNIMVKGAEEYLNFMANLSSIQKTN